MNLEERSKKPERHRRPAIAAAQGLTGDGFGSKSRRGRGATSELRSQGASRGLGEAAARLVVDRGASGRRGRGGAVLCAGRS